MAIFRRRPRAPAKAPLGRSAGGSASGSVGPFWAWWAGAGGQVTAAVEAGDTDAVAALVAPRVEQIHPDLEWEFGTPPDGEAKHLFVVSSGGRPELRSLAERWRRAGPPDDAAWAFRPARQPDPNVFRSGLVMSVGEVEVNIAGVVAQARVDDERCRLDVVVYHPRFADMSEDARTQLAFLVLDWALGEDDVERWLGGVEAVTFEPLDRIQVAMLGSLVGQLAERWSGDRWAMLEGTHGTLRLVATVRHPVHRVDHPLFDEHVAVRLPYTDRLPDGMPGELALGDLRAFEDAVTGRLGRSALLVGHETSSGERLLHLYCDSTASVVPLVEAMLAAYVGGNASVAGSYDPAWRRLEHLRP